MANPSTIWAQLSIPNSPVGSIPFVNTDGITIITDVANFSYIYTNGLGYLYLANKVTFSYASNTVPGNTATVNAPIGRAQISAGNNQIVVSNSQVTATSVVIVQLESQDATATFVKSVVPAAGSFTVTLNANVTTLAKISFLVVGA